MAKTPAEKWKDTIIKYRKQCQSILQISANIRYAGVINEYGRTLTGIIRPNLKPFLKSEQVKNEFFVISTLVSLRKGATAAIGKLDHIIIHHQKVIVLVVQKNNTTYYISVNRKEKDLGRIISLIKKTV